MNEFFLKHIENQLGTPTGNTLPAAGFKQVFGGDINTTFVLTCNQGKYFVKTNKAMYADMYQKEFAGLELLYNTHTLTIPQPLRTGIYKQESYLVMEYFEKGVAGDDAWQQLAAGLALLHKNTNATFGLTYNNYIGTIPQINDPAANWPAFYAARRVLPLIRMARNKKLCDEELVRLTEKFCNKLPLLLPDEAPALLHGDLWSGNKMFTSQREAAVYDPAVYYGHREMDIGMTLLFGGFSGAFYNAYNDVFPLQKDWQKRTDINQLYPLLVHLVLFGKQYYQAVHTILEKYA